MDRVGISSIVTAAAGVLGAVGAAGAAWAAGPMSRLQGVSQHARTQAASGPDHLWAGLGIALILAGVIGAAAFWTLRRRKA